MKRSVLVFPVAAMLLWSCSHNAPGPRNATGAPSPEPSATLENLTNFPLFPSSTIIVTKKFSETVNPDQHAAPLLSQGAGTYGGNEVVAGTPASFVALESWLRTLETDPPKGYRRLAEPSSAEQVRAMVRKRGVDFAVFRDTANPKRSVLVVAIDPATANRDLGHALTLVKRYELLPEALRGNIDDMVKRRTGVSIEQILQPGSPIAVAMNTMSDFSDRNQRAVILIDAQKV